MQSCSQSTLGSIFSCQFFHVVQSCLSFSFFTSFLTKDNLMINLSFSSCRTEQFPALFSPCPQWSADHSQQSCKSDQSPLNSVSAVMGGESHYQLQRSRCVVAMEIRPPEKTEVVTLCNASEELMGLPMWDKWDLNNICPARLKTIFRKQLPMKLHHFKRTLFNSSSVYFKVSYGYTELQH